MKESRARLRELTAELAEIARALPGTISVR